MRHQVVATCALILLAACSGAPATTTPTPAPALAPVEQQTSPAAAPSAMSCPGAVASHQAPEIESVLPASVAGRELTRWSVRGQCWLELTVDTPAHIDEVVAPFTTPSNPNPIDKTQLVYGVAGRSDTKNDPPFFVFAAVRPMIDDEVGLALFLLFGGASFYDVAGAADLTHYEEESIGGKQVYVGALDMLGQDTHQRGRPFLYQNDEYMFLVITDDDAWAADAISQLP